jgi:acyl dehydratase
MTIYLSQDLEFRRPASIGEELTAVCEIVEDLGDNQYRLTTEVRNADGETVIDGEAVVLIDDLPDSA